MTSISRGFFHRLPARLQNDLRLGRQAWRSARRRRALASIGAASAVLPDTKFLLHHLRGQALRRLPKDARHFVSVGCSGSWYFRWIEENIARMPLHTGVELYSRKPPDLPANAKWIANSPSDMPQIGDAHADILFSSQNIEHLWADELLGFLLEAHRIVRQGGLLVMDSPNRRITALLGWSQPEHTVELNSQEIEELLLLAGFDIERHEGIWLCEDPHTGELLPFEQITTTGSWPLQRRVREAAAHPYSSFAWWIEARRSGRMPQPALLRLRIDEIFRTAWPERLNRVKSLIGRSSHWYGGEWLDSCGQGGELMVGPYAPLRAGRYELRLCLMLPDQGRRPEFEAGACQVVSQGGATVLQSCAISLGRLPPGQVSELVLEFSLERATFGVEFRISAMEGIRLAVQKKIGLRVLRSAAGSEQELLEESA